MEIKAVEQKLETIRDQYWESIDTLTKKIWKEEVVPACDKHNMKFGAGMGSYDLECDLVTIYGVENFDINFKTLSDDASPEDEAAFVEKVREFVDLQSDLLNILDQGDPLTGSTLGSMMWDHQPK